MKNIHFIGVGGIWISAVARYYNELGNNVSGSSDSDSELLELLRREWIKISIWHSEDNLDSNTDFVVYTEAIFKKDDFENLVTNNVEYHKAKTLNIKVLSYPQALSEIVNSKQCLAVAWSHWKTTTSSMLGIILKESSIWGSTIVGTQVPQFNNSNFYYEVAPYFVIEACEYRRSFLQYLPYISIVTNIDLDHLDYFKDLEDYISAFKSLQEQTKWYMILNGNCPNSEKLRDKNKKQIWVYEEFFLDEKWQKVFFREFELQIPGKHIEFDAKMAYACAKLLWLDDEYIITKLESYKWVWRRNEIIKTTSNGNIVISDYGHHPTEIRLTLDAIKGKYVDKKLFVVFQPHQYSRTIELLDWFKSCFWSADKLVIPNIYFSRDKEEDVLAMSTEKLVRILDEVYSNVTNGKWLEETAKLIHEYDEINPNSSIIVLMWAWSVDDLRKFI